MWTRQPTAERKCRSWLCGTVAQTSVCCTSILYRGTGSRPGCSISNPDFWQSLGEGTWSPYHSYGRPGWNAWLMISACFRPGCRVHMESKPADGILFILSISLSHSPSFLLYPKQTKQTIFKRKCKCAKNSAYNYFRLYVQSVSDI